MSLMYVGFIMVKILKKKKKELRKYWGYLFDREGVNRL